MQVPDFRKTHYYVQNYMCTLNEESELASTWRSIAMNSTYIDSNTLALFFHVIMSIAF